MGKGHPIKPILLEIDYWIHLDKCQNQSQMLASK